MNRLEIIVLLLMLLFTPIASGSPSRSANECRVCHKTIYDEWQESAHGRSWIDPDFQKRFIEMGRPDECVTCHAPKPVNEKLMSCGPLSRNDNRKEGVSCITCHSEGAIVHGAGTNNTGAHSCTNKSFRNPGLCAPCHSSSCLCFNNTKGNHTRQLGDWVKSPYRTKESCQTCHMPVRIGQTANMRHPELKNTTVHSHSFPGSKDVDLLRNSLGFRVERHGDQLLMTLVNENAGHSLPASEGRTILIRLVFLDENSLEFQHRLREIDAAHCNQLRSGESRVLGFQLYDGWRQVKVSVFYRLHCGDPERKWSLLHHRIFDMQMEYDTPPTGHIADTLRNTQKERELNGRLRKHPITVDEWGRKLKEN